MIGGALGLVSVIDDSFRFLGDLVPVQDFNLKDGHRLYRVEKPKQIEFH